MAIASTASTTVDTPADDSAVETREASSAPIGASVRTRDRRPVPIELGGPPAADEACCAPLQREPLGADEADDLARTVKALADPTRLRLLSIVAASSGNEACVCDLTEPVGLSQPTVSHHLKILTNAGFLTRTQRGTWAYYALVPGSLDRVGALLTAV